MFLLLFKCVFAHAYLSSSGTLLPLVMFRMEPSVHRTEFAAVGSLAVMYWPDIADSICDARNECPFRFGCNPSVDIW